VVEEDIKKLLYEWEKELREIEVVPVMLGEGLHIGSLFHHPCKDAAFTTSMLSEILRRYANNENLTKTEVTPGNSILFDRFAVWGRPLVESVYLVFDRDRFPLLVPLLYGGLIYCNGGLYWRTILPTCIFKRR